MRILRAAATTQRPYGHGGQNSGRACGLGLELREQSPSPAFTPVFAAEREPESWTPGLLENKEKN